LKLWLKRCRIQARRREVYLCPSNTVRTQKSLSLMPPFKGNPAALMQEAKKFQPTTDKRIVPEQAREALRLTLSRFGEVDFD